MRLLIDASGVQFRAGGPAKPKQDYRDKERQAVTRDGRADLGRAAGRDRRPSARPRRPSGSRWLETSPG